MVAYGCGQEGGVMLKGYKDVLEYHLVKWVNLPLPEVDRDPNRGLFANEK